MKRHRKWIAIIFGLLVMSGLVLMWPSSVAHEPRPSLIAGLNPTRTRTITGVDDSEVRIESYVHKISYAEAVKNIDAESRSIGLTRLKSAAIWTADYKGTDAFVVMVDTFPSRRIGHPPVSTLPAMVMITQRKLTTPLGYVRDGFDRAEKRLKSALGVWP